ncbi:MAG: dermonecrotic toxin domain-containing protein [Pseudomonas sp.]|uniref:dermonecrotic toxin domain-containing protein n=1 Tax=Pseudomonas sp. TaxID=306 RepID=UPI003D6FB1A2
MNTARLRPPDLLSIDELPEPNLLEITVTMPDWLSAAGADVRDEYTRQLVAYHACANELQTHLDDVLPSFEEFVHERLAARIKADLGIDVDPDAVAIDLPKKVQRDYQIDPQFGRVKNYAAPWVPSIEREQLSLSELARRNFHADDEQMARRFDFAQLEQDEPASAGGLTAAWLHTVIPELDVAQAYRTKLEQLFRVPPTLTERGQREADLLLEPYERQIQLQGFCELARRRLSEEGYQMLKLAAQARNRTETDAVQLEMSWLQFKPGSSISGERDSHTLSGPCAIRDRITDRTLIYLPDAPVDSVLIEASAPAHALSRLIQLLISKPMMVDYLAERTLDWENTARHVSYINQALARGFEGFIRVVPALDLQIAAQQLHTRAWSLHRRTQARARSKHDLDVECYNQQNDVYLMYFKALLGVLPGIGTLIAVQDGWKEGHDAAQAFREGRLQDGLLALGSSAMNVLDVAMSIVPGLVSVCVLTKLARRGAGLRSAVSAARQPVLKPFAGYEVQKSLVGALPQSGRDIGTVLKDGQLWIQHEGSVYAVYRRSGERTLRLKKTTAHGYEPPVRLNNGTWVYHTDIGLKGGMRSTIAETLIARAHGDPAFKNRHARQLLDQFEFPPDRQRRLELDIAVYYQKHRAVPDWAEAYRRPRRVPDASSQPGPSGVKRKEPPTTDSPARRSPEPGSSSLPARVPGVVSSPESWKSWARPIPDASALQQVGVHPPIFRVTGEQRSSFVQIDAWRYDILPSGASQHPSIVFLKNPDALENSFSGLNETIRRNRHAQPIMASFEGGRWTVHGPLFKHRIHELVEQARPGMTPVSNRILAEKLYEGADHAHTGLTASRLINMRATLNAWQKGQLAPVASMNDPFLMLEGYPVTGVGTSHPRIRLSYGPSLQPFKRLDFTAAEPTLARLLEVARAGSHIGGSAKSALRELMSGVITHAGYHLVPADEAMMHLRSLLLFRRPGQEQLYMLNMRYVSSSHLEFQLGNLDDAIPMSNRWIDEWLTAHPADHAARAVVEARDQGRLVKLVGGLKTGSSTDPSTQLFVQRVAIDL